MVGLTHLWWCFHQRWLQNFCTSLIKHIYLILFPFSGPAGSNHLYMAGGEFPDGSASRSMWRYDPCFDSWQEMASMNVPRSELGRCWVLPQVWHVCLKNHILYEMSLNWMSLSFGSPGVVFLLWWQGLHSSWKIPENDLFHDKSANLAQNWKSWKVLEFHHDWSKLSWKHVCRELNVCCAWNDHIHRTPVWKLICH